MKNIKVSEAGIETVSVAVHVVRISGKQMTLAVFKQLAVEDLFDPRTGELRGIPWGWVNYHAACNVPNNVRTLSLEWAAGKVHGYGFNHLHVVWQKGEELRHAIVYAPGVKPGGNPETQQRMQEEYERLLKLPQLFIAI